MLVPNLWETGYSGRRGVGSSGSFGAGATQVFGAFGVWQANQVMFEYVRTHTYTLACARFLIVAEVNSAINTRIVYVVGDLFQLRVVQDDARSPWKGQYEGMASAAEDFLENLSGAITRGGMGRGVAGKWGSGDKRRKAGIRIGPGIVVSVSGTNSGYRAPADIKIL